MKRLALLGCLVASLCTFASATPSASASVSLSSQSYSCPSYSRYCQTNSQCRGYCGPGVPAEWEICSRGCCACLG
jgi:hypothetical protein